jgi:hypothetical protein
MCQEIINACFVILGYYIGYIACTTHSQKLGFSIPLLLATPVSVGILAVQESCRFDLLLPGLFKVLLIY